MASAKALERARALIGVRFRPQGRSPGSGLDCVGLVAAAFRIPPEIVPDDYRLSAGLRLPSFLEQIERHFRRVPGRAEGNLVVMTIGAHQLHLGVTSDAGLVHADTRRRAVVEGPIPGGARIVGVFRRRRRIGQTGAR